MINKNSYSAVSITILVAILAVVAISLFALPYTQLQLPANLFNSGRSSSAPDFDYEAAADLSAYRWQAMGNYYVQNGLANVKVDSQNYEAYRWRNPANFDQGQPEAAAGMTSGDLSAYRWEAMAKYYLGDASSAVENPELRLWQAWQAKEGIDDQNIWPFNASSGADPNARIERTWQHNYTWQGAQHQPDSLPSHGDPELRIWRTWQENYVGR